MALNPKMKDWRHRVVWLVGASTGIGRACAERLAERGAHVAVSARSADALSEFGLRHRDALILPLDVAEPGVLAGAADTIRERWGRIDLVVYCAGTYRAQRATDHDLADMLRHQQVNYVGALHLLDAVLPVLLEQQAGHISLISSVAGYRGLPQALAYGPTKAALQNLAEVLYLDLSERGIGVSVVNPGFVETPLTAQNEFRMPALISPAAAADAMLAGWARGEFEIHFPKRFTWVLKLIGLLPPSLYFRAIRRATGL
ncbi:SDR family NAD(P)-dependent oxidoreductase [Leptothrix discophora]|uniref:SDR family NAD(P)-dependent oxidoreductase n=1 Tax=Leptothrix discophora TaxID=89 RepID=A0ABT9G6Y6_LEPDI|nr:SDR family NAD(P)-dependent oxidoreductase [Leptothrix discophora]MDP4302243.1 SDR family NAD(P)-dependent oxidoreductase [Leptothrix discophora]